MGILKKKRSKIIGICCIAILLTLGMLPVLLNEETIILTDQCRPDAPGAFIKLPQGVTHYEEAGANTAQTVLLVHGFSVPYYMWDKTFGTLKEQGFHVIRFDLFGRGYSDRPEGEYDEAFFMKQINDLLDALHIEQPIYLIGSSMGGALVTEFTILYPEKVKKLVLLDPVHEAVNISILGVPYVGEYIMDVFVAPAFSVKQMETLYNPAPYAEWPAKYKIQMQFKGFKKALVQTLRNYMTYDKLQKYSTLNKLKKPILLIWGTEDPKLPFEGNERIRGVLDCEFLPVEDAGHLPHFEKPDVVNSHIIQFLKTKTQRL